MGLRYSAWVLHLVQYNQQHIKSDRRPRDGWHSAWDGVGVAQHGWALLLRVGSLARRTCDCWAVNVASPQRFGAGSKGRKRVVVYKHFPYVYNVFYHQCYLAD
jgi:hypothetical protein